MLSATGKFVLVKYIPEEAAQTLQTSTGIKVNDLGLDNPEQVLAKGVPINWGDNVNMVGLISMVYYNYFSANRYVKKSNDPLVPDEVYHFVNSDDIVGFENE